jgi:hypothetical protein
MINSFKIVTASGSGESAIFRSETADLKSNWLAALRRAIIDDSASRRRPDNGMSGIFDLTPKSLLFIPPQLFRTGKQ